MRRVIGWLIQALREAGPTLVVLGLLLAARSSLADQYVVPSGSMEATLQVGDRIAVDKRAYGWRVPFTDVVVADGEAPRAGEVVIFDSADGVRLVKRVAAVGGDVVAVRGGRLWRNGGWVDEPYVELGAGGGPGRGARGEGGCPADQDQGRQPGEGGGAQPGGDGVRDQGGQGQHRPEAGEQRIRGGDRDDVRPDGLAQVLGGGGDRLHRGRLWHEPGHHGLRPPLPAPDPPRGQQPRREGAQHPRAQAAHHRRHGEPPEGGPRRRDEPAGHGRLERGVQGDGGGQDQQRHEQRRQPDRPEPGTGSRGRSRCRAHRAGSETSQPPDSSRRATS